MKAASAITKESNKSNRVVVLLLLKYYLTGSIGLKENTNLHKIKGYIHLHIGSGGSRARVSSHTSKYHLLAIAVNQTALPTSSPRFFFPFYFFFSVQLPLSVSVERDYSFFLSIAYRAASG
jgi:hypothetical protein